MWHIQKYESLETTQDTAINAMRDGAPARTVIVADTMQSGRGRFGNTWQAPCGNLYLSLILRPPSHHTVGDYALMTAVAVARAVRPLLRPDVLLALKWPNDVLVNDRKLSGILIEASWDDGHCTGLVIGVGINVLAPPDGRAGVAQSSKDDVTVDAVRDAFLAALQNVINDYEAHGLPFVRDEWIRQAWHLGQVISFRRTAGEAPIAGVFEGLSVTGSLCLRLPDNTVMEMSAGEIIQTG